MSKSNRLSSMVCGILIGLIVNSARAQSNAIPSVDDVRREVQQLAGNLDDPNFDWLKAPKLIQQAMRDFRAVSQSLSDEERRQLSNELEQQVMPAVQRHQDQFLDALQMVSLLDLQEPLGLSDNEFAALSPLLQNVARVEMELEGGRRRLARSVGMDNLNVPPSALDQATADLKAAVDNTNTSDDLIQTKLAAYRHARDAAKEKLRVAKEALRQVLTVRQEALLVTRGFLD